MNKQPPQETDPLATALDELTESVTCRPYRIARLRESTQESIIRALARGVPINTISGALRKSGGEIVDPKVIKRWTLVPEIAERIDKYRQEG